MTERQIVECDECGEDVGDREPPGSPAYVVAEVLVPTGVRLRGTVEIPDVPFVREKHERVNPGKQNVCLECLPGWAAEIADADTVEVHT